ncbi:MAG TPA: DnaJ C-terminal domain-containing protein [Thermodesulfobacteriota bacterium]
MAVGSRDYYEILGVPRTATTEEIRRAYRRLARRYHPDLAPPAERKAAEERFKAINEAHSVLSDPEKRAQYDRGGAAWQEAPGPEEGPEAADLGDLFERFFGGGPRGRAGRRIVFPGSDVEADLPVTFEEALRGGRRTLRVGERTVEVQVPPGVRTGTRIRLAGQGEPGLGGGPPGDLYLRVRLLPHPRYRVVDDEVEMDLPLWPWQAVLGAEVEVETPDGPIRLKVPPGTQAGRRIRLRGRGLPLAGGGRGDLYAVVRVVIPEAPGPEERAAYEELRRRAGVAADRPASAGRQG